MSWCIETSDWKCGRCRCKEKKRKKKKEQKMKWKERKEKRREESWIAGLNKTRRVLYSVLLRYMRNSRRVKSIASFYIKWSRVWYAPIDTRSFAFPHFVFAAPLPQSLLVVSFCQSSPFLLFFLLFFPCPTLFLPSPILFLPCPTLFFSLIPPSLLFLIF